MSFGGTSSAQDIDSEMELVARDIENKDSFLLEC